MKSDTIECTDCGVKMPKTELWYGLCPRCHKKDAAMELDASTWEATENDNPEFDC